MQSQLPKASNKYLSVPLRELKHIVFDEPVIYQYSISRHDGPMVFTEDVNSVNFSQLAFNLTYLKQKRNLVDKLFQRTRYKLAVVKSREFGLAYIHTMPNLAKREDRPRGLSIHEVTTLGVVFAN